jgi:hypothetical protein
MFFILVALLLCSCIIKVERRDNVGEDSPPGAPVLPAPSGPATETFDEAAQRRKDEADRYIAEVIYRGAWVTGSVQLPSGDIVDGLDRDTLPALPYGLPPPPWEPEDLTLPPGVELGLTDVEQHAELAELVTQATPVERPAFGPYIRGETDAVSIQDYVDRYQEGGRPSADQRLYAGILSSARNRGVSASLNQFRPAVAPTSFSLVEIAVGCLVEGVPEEQIGVVISVDRRNDVGKGGEPRLHIEYARRNPRTGRVQYVWDETDGQFVPNPLRRYRPGQVVPVSEPGGTQVEHPVSIFQVPTGDWWIAYRGELLGYYPARLFTRMNVNDGACEAGWYAEVLKEPGRATSLSEMGSGRFADAGPGYAAYVRNPNYYDGLWFGEVPIDDRSTVMRPYEPSCYSRSALENGVFYFGGPGGHAPGCTWPSP